MTIERAEPPLAAGERAMLDAWFDFHRDTLALKCEGLTEEQLRERAVPPSTMSLLGLVRHMVEGERQRFKYARHNGHADLLRQRIDGAVGV
jgi:Protein of unknown function (DUF664)